MPLSDTDPEIRRRQLAAYRQMSPEQRIEVALGLSEDIRRIALDGIRARNPAADEAQVQAEWLRMLFGHRLASRLADHHPSR